MIGYSQTPSNLQKYWYYRERLKKFVYVSSNYTEPGTNIPAEIILNDTLMWGDGNAAFEHYISVLATEYRLLKNSGQYSDYMQTAKDLYYAMKSFERIDATAESYYRDDHAQYNRDLNGFFNRNDVTPEFWEKYKNNGTSTSFHFQQTKHIPGDTTGNSLDNVQHFMESFFLVNALIDNEYVDGELIDFKQMAKDNVNRMISNMVHTNSLPVFQVHLGEISIPMEGLNASIKIIHFPDIYYSFDWTILSSNWYIMNPATGLLVPNGDGLDFTMNYLSFGFASAGNRLLGTNNFHPLNFSNSIFRGALSSNIVPTENGKFNFNLYNRVAPTLFGPIGYINADFTLYASNYSIGFKKRDDLPFYETLNHEHYEGEMDIDDEKLNSLCALGNINGLRGEPAGAVLMNKYNLANEYKYEHLPIIWSILNNNYAYLNPQFMNDVKTLLDEAPPCGPYKYVNGKNITYGNTNWCSASRLIWPTGVVKDKNFPGDYNGLDYMLLHNLYLLAVNHAYPSYINFSMPTANIPNPLLAVATDRIDCFQPITLTNNSLEFVAGNSISLYPGFKIIPGSGNFIASTFSDIGPYNDLTYFRKVPIDDYPSCGNQLKSTKIISSDNDINSKIENSNNSVSVYPNPTSDKLFVKGMSDFEVNVFDLSERKVLSISNVISTIDVSGLMPGIYMIELKSGNTTSVQKFVKQ